MHSKHTKRFLVILTFFVFIILNVLIVLDLGKSPNYYFDNSDLSYPEGNLTEYDLHSNAPIISTLIIRPNATLINSGFAIYPSGSIHEAIDDNIVYPNSGGDTDYIEGEIVTDYCEVRMGPNMLTSNQKVIGIKIYARGRDYGASGSTTLRISFRWRIGDDLFHHITHSIQFESSTFDWDSTDSWSNIDLTQEDMNDFRVRMDNLNSQTDKFQHLSVMYVELTVRTNRAPDVSVISPIGGEDLQDGTTIEWSYSDLDEETVVFNISYDFGDNEWNLIVSGLVNETSYLWDFNGITITNHTVRIKLTGFDENGGQDNSISGFFTVRINRDPSIQLISPIGGESLQDQAIINWSYSDPDEEVVFFNISYDLGDNVWKLIVSGLINATSYTWDLSNFTQTQSVVRIKIEGNDEYGGYAVNISEAYFSIKINNGVDFSDILIKAISIGSIVGVSGVIFAGIFYTQKKKKKKKRDEEGKKITKKPDPYSAGTHSVITNKNGNKKIIIEGDILVKKGEKYSEKDLLSNFLSQGGNSKKIENSDDYEVIRVLGKINITTLSEDFWEKIDHFEWEKDDKEDFINDMIALPPHCREQFLNEMLERFNGG